MRVASLKRVGLCWCVAWPLRGRSCDCHASTCESGSIRQLSLQSKFLPSFQERYSPPNPESASKRPQPGLTWFLRNLIRDKHNQGDDATKFCSDRISGSYFIMQTNQLLLISATAVTLVQGHLVHFHRPILSFSQISKVYKLKRFDMRSKRHCSCGGDRDGKNKLKT